MMIRTSPKAALIVVCCCIGMMQSATRLFADDGASASLANGPMAPDDLEFFERKIRPLLIQRCYECHSQDSKIVQGGLYLDSREGWMMGGDSGTVIVPGEPDDSLVMEAVRYESFEMPPSGKLPETDIALLERWIKMGAPDPRSATVPKKDPAREREFKAAFWAFQPIQTPPVPAVRSVDWPGTDVDRFILAGLEAEGIQPVADADKRTLLRRIFFDLIGLPPGPDEIDAFLKDDRPDALPRLIDNLLSQPAFGERWGRHWLDVARYADSNGLDENFTFYDAWRYRNYVIDAFNNDKPFDRFIAEQVAGDLLPYDTQQERDTNLTATGFLVVGPKVIGELDKAKLEMDVVDEQIDTVGKAFLGLTLGCARCHDHKFDPIPTRDYYALAGIFTSTETVHGELLNRPDLSGWNLRPLGADGESQYASYAAHRKDIGVLEVERKALQRRQYALEKSRNNGDTPQIGEGAAADQSEPAGPDPRVELKEVNERLTWLAQEIPRLYGEIPPRPQMAMSVSDRAEPGPTAVCIRGDVHRRGEAVPRAFISAVRMASPEIANETSGRLELASWLTGQDHPLTSRVAVNRIWMHLFGEGLVRSVDNFGLQGDRPSHPELLDHLATNFMQDGWSVKNLIRELVLSHTYQLSSKFSDAAAANDPENRLLWRMNRRRLDAESLRDGILAISGSLNRTPAKSTVANVHVQATGVGSPPREPDTSLRRTVYLPVIRNDLPSLLQVFDFADPQVVTGRRDRTTIAPQALWLMNNSLVYEAALRTAEELLANAGHTNDADRVERLYLEVLGRPPEADEIGPAIGLVEVARSDSATDDGTVTDADVRAWTVLCQALFCSTQFQFLD